MPEEQTVTSLEAVDPADPRARAAVASFVAEMAGLLRGGFDPTPATPADDDALREPRGCFLLAIDEADGATVGCGGVRRIGPGIGEVKRMWVDGTRRGAGLGRRVLAALEAEALARGLTTVRLDTRSELVGAVALYERGGYARVAAYNDNPYPDLWFEKQLT